MIKVLAFLALPLLGHALTKSTRKQSLRGHGRTLQTVPDACITAVMNTITGGNPSQGFNVVTCDIFAVVEAVEEAAMNNEAICGQHFGEEILAKMLNVAVIEEGPLIAAMDAVCGTAKAAFDASKTTDFFSMTNQPTTWFKDFYDGGTILNEHVDNDAGTTMLEDEGDFIETFYENVVLKGPISYPDNLANFDNCEADMEAVMCCWVQDRQEDDNGNCASESYADNCFDADPDANTDICYVDYANASGSSRVAGGFAVFDDDVPKGSEGEAHCHGFAWSGNSADDITRYRGNNLFYVSFYDHLYVRGYVRQVPGAAMCGCMKQMPVATRSDCTQVDVLETFNLVYDASSGMSATITNSEVEFNACEAEEDDNDLRAYWRDLHPGDAGKMDKYLVGDGDDEGCSAPITSFLASKGITRVAAA